VRCFANFGPCEVAAKDSGNLKRHNRAIPCRGLPMSSLAGWQKLV